MATRIIRQREDIQPLEEAAGIRQLVETYGYKQLKVAKLLNKSESYISQVLGLERLEERAREIFRKASIIKEAQIQASRETDPLSKPGRSARKTSTTSGTRPAKRGGYFPLNNAGRHSLGMALSRAGVDMNLISALLRHSNAAVTKKHYAEPDMRVLKKVVDNVRAMK